MVVIYRRYIRFDSWRNFRKGSPGRRIWKYHYRFLGSWLGEFLLGPLGPELGGFYLIPALLGAIFALLFIHLWQDVSENVQRKNNFIQIS